MLRDRNGERDRDGDWHRDSLAPEVSQFELRSIQNTVVVVLAMVVVVRMRGVQSLTVAGTIDVQVQAHRLHHDEREAGGCQDLGHALAHGRSITTAGRRASNRSAHRPQAAASRPSARITSRRLINPTRRPPSSTG